MVMAKIFSCSHFNASWSHVKSVDLGLILGPEVLVLVLKVKILVLVLVLVLLWCPLQNLGLGLNKKVMLTSLKTPYF
jgi:hypothetical protein